MIMKERTRQVMAKVNRWLICQIIHLEPAVSGVSIRVSVGNAIHPKWLKERGVYEGVTYRVTSEDTKAHRQWQLMKTVPFPGQKEQGELV